MNSNDVNKLIHVLDEEAARCRLAKRKFADAKRSSDYWEGRLEALAFAVIQLNQADKNAKREGK